ncbi:MAG: S8 family serine peptidase [Actinomycetia bacterium]|nr:S8 family serine peptidase [Actinomycetes bacterium]
MNTRHPYGTTWCQPLQEGWRSLAKTIAVALVLVALAATSLTSATSTEPVGLLGTSMVDMLAIDDGSDPVLLEDVHSFVESFLEDESVDGTGIDVAVIDTGVAPVDGLDGTDKVLHGPDLSFEGSSPEFAYLDTYGHGTHMAGIIAGERTGHEGIAPGARIVSVKTAGHDGITSVPQVVAAIDWVVEHRNTNGLNIRVLNLSLGQADVSDHVGDGLSAAVERAWDAGIFVVVAAGNDGDSQAHLDSPAIDPYVLAVGAEDTNEGEPALWTGRGDGDRNPDVMAPGRSIASYRVPGSTVDTAAPGARYGQDLFLGSGTSQSAAVTSGIAALILESRPELSPDELKATIVRNAVDMGPEYVQQAGAGKISANKADKGLDTANATQTHPEAAGTGTGIAAPTGSTWSGTTWSGSTWSGSTWSGSTWSGSTWSGTTWSGNGWT